jgi:hypothetical protein
MLLLLFAGGPALSLVVDDAAHAQTANSPALTTRAALTAADSTHPHAADSPALTARAALAAASASHQHAADSPTLGTALSVTLTVADAQHEHSADSPALTARAALAAASASHTHAADAPELHTVTALAVTDAEHAHTAGNADLIAHVTLTVADAQHAHAADTVLFGGASLTQPGRRVVRAEPRTRTVDNIPEPHMRPKTLDTIDVAETDTVTFDYGRLLAPAETLLSATVTCATASGTDEDAATRLQGAPVVQPSRVLQRVSGGLSGVTYHLRSVAATSENRTLTLPALLPCRRM